MMEPSEYDFFEKVMKVDTKLLNNDPATEKKVTGAIRKTSASKFRVDHKKYAHPGFTKNVEDIFGSRVETTRKLNKMCDDIDTRLQVLDDHGDEIEQRTAIRTRRYASQYFQHILECSQPSMKQAVKPNAIVVIAEHHYDHDKPPKASAVVKSQNDANLSFDHISDVFSSLDIDIQDSI